jgi:hypothetical protein
MQLGLGLEAMSSENLYEFLHCVCLSRFRKERNKKERNDKEIEYFHGLDDKRNDHREKYNEK